MRNYSTLCLLLSAAGLAHASIVYDAFTGEVPATAVNQPISDSTNDASSYALDVRLGNIQYISGDFAPTTSPCFSAFCIEPREFGDGVTSYTWTSVPLDQGTPHIGGMGIAENVIPTNEGAPALLSSLIGSALRLDNMDATIASGGVGDTVAQVPGDGIPLATAEFRTFGVAGVALIGLGWSGRRG